MPRRLLVCCLAALLAACAAERDDGITDIAFITSSDDLIAEGVHLSYAQSHVRAATALGLVTLDAQGEVVPAIAERWIVTDDGESYIFRLRDIELVEGERLTAAQVRAALMDAMRQLENTTVGRDLDKIRDVRALTGRVIEIRLYSPMPGLLQLMAQPELGLRVPGANLGPMEAELSDGVVNLAVRPPSTRGLPQTEGWEEEVRPLRIYAEQAETATRGFYDGRYDVVLGGTILDLPLIDTGPLSRGTVRADSVVGLFGLDIRRAEGFLANPTTREALSAALDREALLEPFGLAGWASTTRLVPTRIYAEATVGERWDEAGSENGRARLSQAASAWQRETGAPPPILLFLPPGPGADILFGGLRSQYGALGIDLQRAETPSSADLVLRDRAARYASPRWFLNQFACPVAPRLCNTNADFLVELAAETTDAREQSGYLLEAESALLSGNRFIPFGQPVRWSLVRSGVEGFAENTWGLHPLFPFSGGPI